MAVSNESCSFCTFWSSVRRRSITRAGGSCQKCRILSTVCGKLWHIGPYSVAPLRLPAGVTPRGHRDPWALVPTVGTEMAVAAGDLHGDLHAYLARSGVPRHPCTGGRARSPGTVPAAARGVLDRVWARVRVR